MIIIKYLLVNLIIWLILYLSGAFIIWNFNPKKWFNGDYVYVRITIVLIAMLTLPILLTP